MSELPEAATVQLSYDHEMPELAHYFGRLGRQAAINSVTAYVDVSADENRVDDRDVTLACLLNDRSTLDKLLAGKHREARLHGALMRASTHMWASVFMQQHSYIMKRPDRLKGLTQSEIPVA